MVDQVGVHQGVAQDHQPVGITVVHARRVDAQLLQHAHHLLFTGHRPLQGGDGSEEASRLQGLARVAAQVLVEPAHEGVGAGQVAVAARIDRQAHQVAVRCERHADPEGVCHLLGETPGACLEGLGRQHRLPRQQAEVGVVQRQHLVGDVHRRGRRPGFGAFRDELAQLPVAGQVAVPTLAEYVVGLLGQQRHAPMVTADEGTGAVGQVAQLVRIDGDRIGACQRREGGVHFRLRELPVLGAHLFQAAQATVGASEHRAQVTPPGGIHVDPEAQAARQRRIARIHHRIHRVDGAVLGTAQHRHRHQHRLPLALTLLQHLLQAGRIQAHATNRQQPQLLTAQAQQLQALAPGVMGGDRRQHLRHRQRRVA